MLIGQVAGREAKVELDAGAVALAGGLAEKLPARVAREAVLGEVLCRRAVAARAKDLNCGTCVQVSKEARLFSRSEVECEEEENKVE